MNGGSEEESVEGLVGGILCEEVGWDVVVGLGGGGVRGGILLVVVWRRVGGRCRGDVRGSEGVWGGGEEVGHERRGEGSGSLSRA